MPKCLVETGLYISLTKSVLLERKDSTTFTLLHLPPQRTLVSLIATSALESKNSILFAYYAVSLYTNDGLENNTERHSTEQYGSYQILFFFFLSIFGMGNC